MNFELSSSLKSQEDFLAEFDSDDDSWSNQITIDEESSESDKINLKINWDNSNSDNSNSDNSNSENSNSDNSSTEESNKFIFRSTIQKDKVILSNLIIPSKLKDSENLDDSESDEDNLFNSKLLQSKTNKIQTNRLDEINELNKLLPSPLSSLILSQSKNFGQTSQMDQISPVSTCSTPTNKYQSAYNLRRLESFEAKLPRDLSKEKKMSLLIVVLLQIIFNNNNDKLSKIYNLLGKKNILDIEVTSSSYSYLRSNLSFMIESLNKTGDKINDKKVEHLTGNSESEYNFGSELNLKHMERSLNFTNTKYTNKYRNNFNQINLLGKGGYGSVYKVFHRFEKKYYAIKKVFVVQDLLDENYDIFNEIQVYSNLIHNNIVRYYSSWVDIDLTSIIEFNKSIDIMEEDPIGKLCPILFIQMELCDLTLKEYFLTRISEDSINKRIGYFKQITNGLNYLHSNNLIHRDIKPDNIFITTDNSIKKLTSKIESGQPKLNELIEQTEQIELTESQPEPNYIFKLGDFGLSTKIQSKNKLKEGLDHIVNLVNDKSDKSEKSTDSNNLIDPDELSELSELISLSSEIGTGIYRAPEIDSGKYNYKIDIYALGVILIEFLINSYTNYEKTIKIRDIESYLKNYFEKDNYELSELKIPHIITNDYDELIIRMINPNPSLRPKTDEILSLLDM